MMNQEIKTLRHISKFHSKKLAEACGISTERLTEFAIKADAKGIRVHAAYLIAEDSLDDILNTLREAKSEC